MLNSHHQTTTTLNFTQSQLQAISKLTSHIWLTSQHLKDFIPHNAYFASPHVSLTIHNYNTTGSRRLIDLKGYYAQHTSQNLICITRNTLHSHIAHIVYQGSERYTTLFYHQGQPCATTMRTSHHIADKHHLKIHFTTTHILKNYTYLITPLRILYFCFLTFYHYRK